jgi:hypothetical protein
MPHASHTHAAQKDARHDAAQMVAPAAIGQVESIWKGDDADRSHAEAAIFLLR